MASAMPVLPSSHGAGGRQQVAKCAVISQLWRRGAIAERRGRASTSACPLAEGWGKGFIEGGW